MSKLTKEQEFIIFCMEAYRKKYKLSGQNIFEIFQKFDIFLFLEKGYDVLHTQSIEYIVSEIHELIKNRK
jgi:hypothetical protein